MIVRIKTFIIVVAAFVVFATGSAHACPGCKQTTRANGRDMGQVQKGFSYSVLFMLLFPMGLIYGVGHYSLRTLRRFENERDAAAAPEHKNLPS
ncbi:hypothetical protein QQ055_10665 [Geitlerinema calcuttense NRMC-F 0142]|uniref:Uncharacterized protein n=1 Tax=Geitlerinema calcuttense NRMC-F 0142 TaxID=2922238 RepID=A0ABT7M0X4_9CYAN|nr:hypothetical protein [Geitlerinema calcuttense NRMC-F 0142]